jgi:hypothetical protein
MTSPKSNVVNNKLTCLIGMLNPEAFDKLVLLQELHFKQIAAMAATNKADIDAMTERLNAWYVTNKLNGNFTTVQGKGCSTFRLPMDHQQDNKTTAQGKESQPNYWSPLACPAEEQEESPSESTTNVEMAMLAIAKGVSSNKIVAHWVQKLQNRKSRRFALLDSGATSGAAPEEDAPDLDDTRQPSQKTFMFPDGCTGKATKKMLLKHNLRLATREMKIVPGLHSALVSIPKLADAGYTTFFNKNGAAIYDDKTTTFTATNPPVLESE